MLALTDFSEEAGGCVSSFLTFRERGRLSLVNKQLQTESWGMVKGECCTVFSADSQTGDLTSSSVASVRAQAKDTAPTVARRAMPHDSCSKWRLLN